MDEKAKELAKDLFDSIEVALATIEVDITMEIESAESLTKIKKQFGTIYSALNGVIQIVKLYEQYTEEVGKLLNALGSMERK